MKKIGLFVVLFTFLALSLSNLPAVSKTTDETRVTGILNRIEPRYTGSNEDSFILGEKGYWLTLDSPIVFNEGSKSERVVKGVKLTVPADLQEKVQELDGQHVAVVGILECVMHYSPWGASCNMLVEQIEQNNFKDILGTWDRFDPETGEKFDYVVIASMGNVLEVTVFAGFSGWVTIPAQFDGRKLKYKYVHKSPSCDVAYEVDVSMVATGLMQGYLNSKVLRTNPGFPIKVGRKASVPTELRKR